MNFILESWFKKHFLPTLLLLHVWKLNEKFMLNFHLCFKMFFCRYFHVEDENWKKEKNFIILTKSYPLNIRILLYTHAINSGQTFTIFFNPRTIFSIELFIMSNIATGWGRQTSTKLLFKNSQLDYKDMRWKAHSYSERTFNRHYNKQNMIQHHMRSVNRGYFSPLYFPFVWRCISRMKSPKVLVSFFLQFFHVSYMLDWWWFISAQKIDVLILTN